MARMGTPTVSKARIELCLGVTGKATPTICVATMSSITYSVRVRSSRTTSSIPLTIRCPSLSAVGRAAKESPSSTMSATLRAAWLQLSMATPT